MVQNNQKENHNKNKCIFSVTKTCNQCNGGMKNVNLLVLQYEQQTFEVLVKFTCMTLVYKLCFFRRRKKKDCHYKAKIANFLPLDAP